MKMHEPQEGPGVIAGLPESVKTVRLFGDREILLVGTAHVSRKSVEDVRQTIELSDPDSICVELCQTRYENITNRERWKNTDIVKIIREKKAMFLLSSLILTSFQKRIGQKLGVEPGAEMKKAVELAPAKQAELVLADRDIQITLRRTWARLGFFDKLKMFAQLSLGLVVTGEIDEETIEEIKKDENLADILEMLAREFPKVKATLIDERDVYLAGKIRQAPGRRVVAVVGAGHVPGILRELEEIEQKPLEPLMDVPPPSWWPSLLKWGIPAAVVALLVIGFLRAGAEHSLGSIYIWVLVNGVLSALGALLALGHPLTVLAAFLAAPLTSLNPMIAAGWVAGLVQAIVKRPRVEDLENLPEAIVSVKGFWLNPVTRILLVVAFANLGSVLGTFISGGWIAARTIG